MSVPIPPKDEVERVLAEAGSITGLGRHYGRSDWWASKTLARHGIAAPRPPLHSRRTGRDVLCEWCGDQFYASASEIARNRKFCSCVCRAKGSPNPMDDPVVRAKAAHPRGPKHPTFKHGLAPDTVRSNHVSVKIKGEDACRACGVSGALHMHHVIPRSMFKAGITEILNCIPLCPSCHRRWHARSLTIYREVFTPDEWAYLSSVKLLGQNVQAWLDDRYPAISSSGGQA